MSICISANANHTEKVPKSDVFGIFKEKISYTSNALLTYFVSSMLVYTCGVL